MASSVTMVQPPPPRGSSASSSSHRCAPTPRHPPPPPSESRSKQPSNPISHTGKKRVSDTTGSTQKNTRRKVVSTLKFPMPLRDVTVFDKKYQVGQGTYGCVLLNNY